MKRLSSLEDASRGLVLLFIPVPARFKLAAIEIRCGELLLELLHSNSVKFEIVFKPDLSLCTAFYHHFSTGPVIRLVAALVEIVGRNKFLDLTRLKAVHSFSEQMKSA